MAELPARAIQPGTSLAVAAGEPVVRVLEVQGQPGMTRPDGEDVVMLDGRDHWYHELMRSAPAECPAEPMDAEQLLRRIRYMRIAEGVDFVIDGGGDIRLRGTRIAQVKLATYYLQHGAEELARAIYDDMKGELPERLASIREEMANISSQDFWEMSDRGVERLKALFDPGLQDLPVPLPGIDEHRQRLVELRIEQHGQDAALDPRFDALRAARERWDARPVMRYNDRCQLLLPHRASRIFVASCKSIFWS